MFIIGRLLKAVKEAFLCLNEEATAVRMEVNEQETKLWVVETRTKDHLNVCMFGKYQFEKVSSLKCLGYTINNSANETEKIMRGTLAGNSAYFSLMRILRGY